MLIDNANKFYLFNPTAFVFFIMFKAKYVVMPFMISLDLLKTHIGVSTTTLGLTDLYFKH